MPVLLYVAILSVAFGQSPRPAAPSGKTEGISNSLAKDGSLVVSVTWGDLDNTPADDVYVEAHGFVEKYREEKSFILKMSRAGRYEASLPPAVYDVFVSEGTSIPQCKRVLIKSGSATDWTLKLEIDYVYTDK